MWGFDSLPGYNIKAVLIDSLFLFTPMTTKKAASHWRPPHLNRNKTTLNQLTIYVFIQFIYAARESKLIVYHKIILAVNGALVCRLCKC